MKTEELPDHRYLSADECLDPFIGKEVFARWPTDYGDETYWEKGILASVSIVPGKERYNGTAKGMWKVHINGAIQSFPYCAIEVPKDCYPSERVSC